MRNDLSCDKFVAKYSGVQISDTIQELLLAGLIYFTCKYKDEDLTLLRFENENTLLDDINHFMNGEDYITSSNAKGPFCKTKSEVVQLICRPTCRSPWIEGSTSRAIYGEKQKEFASHVCSKCKNWFHYFCLRQSNVKVPNRTQDFVCPMCQIPTTISLLLAHSKYTNTCTSDICCFIVVKCLHSLTALVKVLPKMHSKLL